MEIKNLNSFLKWITTLGLMYSKVLASRLVISKWNHNGE